MKILLTGSNGLLGQKLVHKLKADPKVELLATARGANRLNNQEGYNYKSLDVTSAEKVEAICAAEKPEVIIHTAAMTNVDACETDREWAYVLNVEAVAHLIVACRKHNIHLVHLSTDFIFDGADGPYDEEAKPNPVSYYGETKLKAEQLIKESGIPAAILRTVLVYGVAEEMSRSNIVLWAKGALESGKKITVVDDQFRSPTLAEDLADGCILAALQKAEGVYNISGADFMSVLELVQRVGKAYDLDTSFIEPISSSTLNQTAKRPPKTGFILDKAKEQLGYKPHSFEEGLELVKEQFNKRSTQNS
jgi:dTDP-4-dehydrorhamnose reductase